MLSTYHLLILCSVFCVTLSQYDFRDDVPWYKARQTLRDRFLTGNIKGRNTYCTGTRQASQVQGICVPFKECLLLGGSTAGTCALLGSCCIVERTCFNSTRAKVSYFVNPSYTINAANQQLQQPQCSLTVNLFNRDVCQIRLDFEIFSLIQPSRVDPGIAPPGQPGSELNAYQCLNDSFTVSNAITGNNLGFLHLCGENAGQHIYIPVNGTQGTGSITLNFQLQADRNANLTATQLPQWRIRITQLECSMAPVNLNNIQSALVTMYQRFKNKKNNNIQTDAALIAPPGCLQYYTERTGTYESFNYNNGVGPYIGQMNYAICFRRTTDVCSIRHTTQSFQMSYNTLDAANFANTICNSLNTDLANNVFPSQDYIIIPGGVNNTQFTTDIYCDTMLGPGNVVTSSTAGPFYVAVRHDGRSFSVVNGLEFGFRFTYELLNTGCNGFFN